MANRWAPFCVMTVLFWLFAHSAALFSHEFAHSFSAMALGWKGNPFDLSWGGPSALNLVLQTDIDENVDYRPIFESGHGFEAGVIALAGSALGNLCLSLTVGLWLFATARRRGIVALGAFAYWLVVMSVGNLISYVPLRVFTTHADMHTVQEGFGWTPFETLVYVGIPFFSVVLWFFLSFQLKALAWMFHDSAARRCVMVFLTSATVFGFFCLGGIAGYGETSHLLSIAFIAGLAPLTLCWGLLRTRKLNVAAPQAVSAASRIQ